MTGLRAKDSVISKNQRKDTLQTPGEHTDDLYITAAHPIILRLVKGVINIPSHHTILRSISNKYFSTLVLCTY